MEDAAVIQGKHDTYLTPRELGGMIDRSEKTIHNWVAGGRLQFVYLCGRPLVSMAMLEALIAGTAGTSPPAAEAALRVIGRRDRAGRRTEPEQHRRRHREGRIVGESGSGALLPSSPAPVGSSPS
jgi:hypothetical protein